MKEHLILGWNIIKVMKKKAIQITSRYFALLCNKLNWAHYHFSIWQARYRLAIMTVMIIILICVSAYFSPVLQKILEERVLSENSLANLQSLFIAVGSALVGASVIVLSLVLFAMQVNIDRMPYGLFRKFSTDKRIIASFSGSFLLAISIACVSLIPNVSWAAVSIIGSAWGIILIFVLFFYAYRRALVLINPSEQLRLVVKESKCEINTWVRRAIRAAPLLKKDNSTVSVNNTMQPDHDLSRTAYFKINQHWTKEIEKAIQRAITFARRYAESGDYEVSDEALAAVVLINKDYVDAKGKTFFSNSAFIDNPLSTDGFINNTLELLRQTNRIGIARGDEQQIEQTFHAMAMLVKIYNRIDYSDKYATKFHAGLAAGYLSEAVKASVPHNLADVLMEGTRLIGQSANVLLKSGDPNCITTLTDNIEEIAYTGVLNENYRPVTKCAIEQLAKLTISLLQVKQRDIRFAAKHLKMNITRAAKLFLNVPDIPLMSLHSAYLAPYYSSTNTQSLQSWLAKIVNDLLVKSTAEDHVSKTIIRNIEMWADELYQPQKELLVLAIEKRSHFTFDVIHWISDITKILLAVSNTPACDDRIKEKLRRHASWLACTLDWIPDDKETVAFVETFQLTEIFFELSRDAHHRGCPNIAEKMFGLLMDWAFRGGKHQVGWTILERSFYGLVTLALIIGDLPKAEKLKSEINVRLNKSDAPEQEIRKRTAENIRDRAATLYNQGHWSSRIDYQMTHMDHDIIRPLLEDLANLLFPDTSAG